MLFILFLGIIVPTAIGQPHVEYLIGVQRLTNSSYTDYYFSCDLTGNFLQWLYNDVPLRGFGIHDAGRVVVITGPTYNYTATLLSSQLDPETNQRRLDSVLVLSFNGNHPRSSFEVTCSSSSDFNTTQVDGVKGNIKRNSSSNGEVVLDHIISTEIVQNKNRTHIFICGAHNDLQFYDIQSSRAIGFNEHDEVGRARTDLSQDGNLVNIQGVLIAQLPNQKTSLLFITENPDVTVTCFFGNTQAVLNSNQVAPKESNPLPPPLHSAPVTTTTTNSSASHATTMLSSTAYGTDGTGFAGSSSKVAAAVSVLLCGAVSIIVVAFIIKISRKRKIIECSEKNEKIHVVTSCITFQSQREEYLPNPPTYDAEYGTSEIGPSKSIHEDTADLKSPPSKDVLMETPEENTSDSAYGSNSSSDETGSNSSSDETGSNSSSDETGSNSSSDETGSNSSSDETGSNSPSDETPDKEDASVALDMDIDRNVSLKKEDIPMVADLEKIGIGGGKLEHESASSSGHTSETIQYSVEESSSGEASLRICESLIHHFGHEHGGLEPVKSFGSLQEAVFIGADGLGQSYWNASVSKSSDVVLYDESPDVATTATGITFRVLIQNLDNNVDVMEKFVCTTCDTHNDVHATEEGNEPHDDVCITEDDKDPHDDAREDSGDVNVMDAEDSDALDDVHIMEEDQDALEDALEEDKDALGDVPITKEDKDALGDVPSTEEDKDALGDVPVTEEDKNALGDVPITKEDKDVLGDVPITEEDKDALGDVPITKEDKDALGDVPITEEDKDALGDVPSTEEDKDALGDVPVTEEDKDALGDVPITKEDKDALGDVPITEEDKDALGDVPVTEEDKDALGDVPVTEENKDAHGNVHILEEDKHAKSDKRATAEEIGAQSGQDSGYYIKLKRLRESICELISELEKIIKKFISFLHVSFPYPYHKKLRPVKHLVEMPKKERVSSTVKNRHTWREIGLGWGTGITSFMHGCVGSMDEREDVYVPYTRPISMNYWNLNEEWMYREKQNNFFTVSMKRDFGDTDAVDSFQEKWTYWKEKRRFSAVSMIGDPGDAVDSFQTTSSLWFSLISITEARKSITEIVQAVQLAFKMVQTPMLCLQDVLWLQPCKSEISEVPLDGGGTLHVPVVGTSSWWGRVRLDLLKCTF